MDNINAQNVADALPLEVRLWEKLYELQQSTETIDSMQKELLQCRHTLYHVESLLEDERRVTSELRIQLKGALDVVARLEDEKIKDHLAQVQLQMNYNNVLTERISLMEEAKSEREKGVKYKIRIETLESELQGKEVLNKNLMESLSVLQNNTLIMINSIQENMTKLRKEQSSLQRSCEATIELNKRLQTVGLCAHAVYQRADVRIKALQSKIASLSVTNVPLQNIEAIQYPEIQAECQKEDIPNETQMEQTEEDPSTLLDILIRELEKSSDLTF